MFEGEQIMAVQVYFMRHGIAADPEDYAKDSDRPLTPKGRTKTEAIVQHLKQLNLQFDEILSSPLVRAHQTAEILLEQGLAPQLTVSDVLAPQGSFSDWLAWLKLWQQSGHESLVLVGHEPDLSQWAELLIWGDVKGAIALKKAGMIGITIPDAIDPIGNSTLFWLTPPKFLILG
jgi:phosphohistidine phosphatase